MDLFNECIIICYAWYALRRKCKFRGYVRAPVPARAKQLTHHSQLIDPLFRGSLPGMLEHFASNDVTPFILSVPPWSLVTESFRGSAAARVENLADHEYLYFSANHVSSWPVGFRITVWRQFSNLGWFGVITIIYLTKELYLMDD